MGLAKHSYMCKGDKQSTSKQKAATDVGIAECLSFHFDFLSRSFLPLLHLISCPF